MPNPDPGPTMVYPWRSRLTYSATIKIQDGLLLPLVFRSFPVAVKPFASSYEPGLSITVQLPMVRIPSSTLDAPNATSELAFDVPNAVNERSANTQNRAPPERMLKTETAFLMIFSLNKFSTQNGMIVLPLICDFNFILRKTICLPLSGLNLGDHWIASFL